MRMRAAMKTNCYKKGASLWEMNEGVVYQKMKSNRVQER